MKRIPVVVLSLAVTMGILAGSVPTREASGAPQGEVEVIQAVPVGAGAPPASMPPPEAPEGRVGEAPAVADEADADADADNAAPERPPSAEGGAPVAEADGTPEPPAPPRVEVTPSGPFPVTAFEFEYVLNDAGLPPPAELGRIVVDFSVADGVYDAPDAGAGAVEVTLEDAAGPTATFTPAALLHINQAIVAHFNARDIYGVFVLPDPEDVDQERSYDPAGNVTRVQLVDRRAEGRTALRILIFVGRVVGMRTLAAGERFDPDDRVDNPAHAWLRNRSPVQPVGPDGEGGLLRKEALDAYLAFLGRHPGRQVDVSVARADQPGDMTLDYHVSESKPWYVYHETSNTGTEETGEWRSRFGFIHNQLTGHDDVLALDYQTAQFNTTHAASVSYEAPIVGYERLRYAFYGTYSEFTASEVGLGEEVFLGKVWSTGMEVFWNCWQQGDLFVDLLAGMRWQHEGIDNLITLIQADADLWLPSVGLRVEKQTDLSSFRGTTRVEWLDEKVAATNEDELMQFGRFNPDTDWVLVRWDVAHAFFLEPLVNPAGWRDPDTWHNSTLAHEMLLRFHGQHSLGHRLIPSQQVTAGGVYRVRGYPESVVAGDTAYLGTVEYRYHLPRAFRPSNAYDEPREPFEVLGRPFRFRPQHVYGPTDWDFVLKGFFDVAKVNQYDRLDPPLEENRLLMGCGVGMELRVMHNLSVRLDYGVALRGIDPREVDAGDQRLHVIATISY